MSEATSRRGPPATGTANENNSFVFANHVYNSSVTTPTQHMLDLGLPFGKIGISITQNLPDKEPGFFYSYFEAGNNSGRVGVGINVFNLMNTMIGGYNDGTLYYETQIAQTMHVEYSVGPGGYGVVIGIDKDNTEVELEIKYGFKIILAAITVAGFILGYPIVFPNSATEPNTGLAGAMQG